MPVGLCVDTSTHKEHHNALAVAAALACDHPNIEWQMVLMCSLEAKANRVIRWGDVQCVVDGPNAKGLYVCTIDIHMPGIGFVGRFRGRPSGRYPHQSGVSLMAYATLVAKGILSPNETGFANMQFNIEPSETAPISAEFHDDW